MRVFLFAILWICATAQEFKDAVIYEAAGDIKSIKLKTKDIFGSSSSFYNDGSTKAFAFEHDDLGYPTYCEVKISGKRQFEIRANYDDSHNLIEILYANVYCRQGIMQKTFTYDTGGCASQCNVIVAKVPDKMKVDKDTFDACNLTANAVDTMIIASAKYENYVFDDKGNWISRDVHQTINYTNPKNKDKDIIFTEKRKIKYHTE